MTYKISVIIPLYNSEKFLDKCITSVCDQSFEDFELILVNDGSTDNSGSICDAYAVLDSRIRVFHHNNMGVSFARNLGIKNAVGDWITFIDSDDFVDRDYLKNFYDHIGGNAGLMIQGMKRFDSGTIDVFYEFGNSFRTTKNDFLEKFSIIPYFFGPVSKLYSHDFIKRNNIHFDLTKSYAEDTLFNLDYLKACNSDIILLSYNTYYYRATPESLSTAKLNFTERFILFNDLVSRLENLTDATHHYYWYSAELLKSLYIDESVKSKRKVLKELVERWKNLLLVPYRGNDSISRLITLLIKSNRIVILDLLFKFLYRQR